MDPLSIIASTITLAAATVNTLEALRVLHDAAKEVHALINEVSDLSVVLQEVERSIKERQSHQQLPQLATKSICTHLGRAKEKLSLLDNLIKRRLTDSVSVGREPKVARIAWLRHKSKAKELQEELKEIRLGFSTLWGAANL